MTLRRWQSGQLLPFQFVLLLVLVVYLLLIPLGLISPVNRLGFSELFLVAILLFWASGAIGRLADISVSSTGLSAKFQEIEHRQQEIHDRQNEAESRIHTLQLLVKGLVTEFEYDKLKGLAESSPFMVTFHNDMYEELKRLDAIRYIQPQPGYGLVSIRERDGRADKFDLKQYVQITSEGLEYLRLRAELLQSRK
jgi:hypothetical protein